MYEYRAALRRVIDADTFEFTIDLGLDVSINLTARLHGVDAPERRFAEGKVATEYVKALLAGSPLLTVRTHKDRREKYGRYLVDVLLPDGRDLAQELVAAGHAIARVYA